MTALPHAPRPCSECPWRLDAEPGKFPPSRYDALQATAGRPGAEAGLTAPIFACHMTVEGKDRACAGWLAVVGVEHLGIRFAVAMGRLPASALEPQPEWPGLYPSYEALAAANGADPGGRRRKRRGRRMRPQTSDPWRKTLRGDADVARLTAPKTED